MRLLIIEDSQLLITSLMNGFIGLGYRVDAVTNGSEGWALACEARHDALILDRILPELDGLEIVRRLRNAGSQTPILLLSALDSVVDRVAGLEAGADDYLVKPFALTELIARVQTLVRRGRHRKNPVVTFADLTVDTTQRAVSRSGQRVDLSPREYQLLLLHLLERPGEILTREEIHAHIAPHDATATSNLVDVLVGRLRRKLHRPGLPPLLHTRRGLGYQLAVE